MLLRTSLVQAIQDSFASLGFGDFFPLFYSAHLSLCPLSFALSGRIGFLRLSLLTLFSLESLTWPQLGPRTGLFTFFLTTFAPSCPPSQFSLPEALPSTLLQALLLSLDFLFESIPSPRFPDLPSFFWYLI